MNDDYSAAIIVKPIAAAVMVIGVMVGMAAVTWVFLMG